MRRQGKRSGLRVLAASFTVTAPSGARIRDRLRLAPADEKVLRLVGEHLGRHQRADLAARVRLGDVKAKDTRRAERKKKLTAVSSSRWAGAITRASEDQYQLSMRCLHDERASLHRAIHTITRRLATPCGKPSRWGAQHWAKPLQNQTMTTVTRHHGASVAIARRALGYGIRRRPGVTAHHRRMVERRATGQTVSLPRACGTASPLRTAGTANDGGKTRLRPRDQLALFPGLEDRSRGHPANTGPGHGKLADTGERRQEW